MVNFNYVFILLCFCLQKGNFKFLELNVTLTKIWGPGLRPNVYVMPARYFFIEAYDHRNTKINKSLPETFKITLEGIAENEKPCRIWTNSLDRKDGTYIVRYKLYETCSKLTIQIQYKNVHVAESPYVINQKCYSDNCQCPLRDLDELINKWICGSVPNSISKQLDVFDNINWITMRETIIKNFDKPHSISLCHYVVKENKIYRKCYGKYVGFNMFMDNILHSLSRKTILPDLEFFVNLGDWPLARKDLTEKFPILSWCGSVNNYDIIMPTYDLTESTLENMGRVMLDMLSVQGNVELNWSERVPKLFWRGRDSNQHRLDLIDISREHRQLFNVSLTNFFFFRDKEHIYGPKTEHESFFKFFNYKYQLAIDGTVSAYRMPYLLGGGSLIFKQESKYFEHFYNDLVPYKHYVPIKTDLSDLVEKLQWALKNDDKAEEIAKTGRAFANSNLLPKHIFCYHSHLFNELSKKITSKVTILDGMEEIKDSKLQQCDCDNVFVKDEL